MLFSRVLRQPHYVWIYQNALGPTAELTIDLGLATILCRRRPRAFGERARYEPYRRLKHAPLPWTWRGPFTKFDC